MSDNEKKAYDEGYFSYPDKDCPYSKDTDLFMAWWNGYAQCDWDSAYWTD